MAQFSSARLCTKKGHCDISLREYRINFINGSVHCMHLSGVKMSILTGSKLYKNTPPMLHLSALFYIMSFKWTGRSKKGKQRQAI